MKRNSLSIGEFIATSAVSIYRQHFLDLAITNWFPASSFMSSSSSLSTPPLWTLLYYRGYIDDILGMCFASSEVFSEFVGFCKSRHPTITLKLIDSNNLCDYLDLRITRNGKKLETQTYREPTFSPLYIPRWSYLTCSDLIFSGLVRSDLV